MRELEDMIKEMEQNAQPFNEIRKTIPKKHKELFTAKMLAFGWDISPCSYRYVKHYGDYEASWEVIPGGFKMVMSDPKATTYSYTLDFNLYRHYSKSRRHPVRSFFIWHPNLLDPNDALDMAITLDKYAENKFIKPYPDSPI